MCGKTSTVAECAVQMSCRKVEPHPNGQTHKSETTESGMCYRECNTAVRCSRDGTRGTLKLMRMKEGKFVIVTEY